MDADVLLGNSVICKLRCHESSSASALDGGRLVFLLIEAVTKKKVNPNIEGMIHFAGFVLLMALMVLYL